MSTARNDAIFNTGMNSALDRKRAMKLREQQSAKSAVRATLKPSEELVLRAIENEKKKVVSNLATLPLTFESHEEDLKAYLLAQRMHLDFITSFQTVMLNAMRARPEKTDE